MKAWSSHATVADSNNHPSPPPAANTNQEEREHETVANKQLLGMQIKRFHNDLRIV